MVKDDNVLELIEEDITRNSIDALISSGEWEQLYLHPDYQVMSRITKITTLHESMSIRERHLERHFYEIVRMDTIKGQEFLDTKLKRIRHLKRYLTNCLMWEYTGEIPPHTKPKELEKHI